MKLLNGTLFGITGNLLNFTINEKSQNLTEIMFKITINHFNIIRKPCTGNHVRITLSTAINLIEIQEAGKRSGFALHFSKLENFNQQTFLCVTQKTQLILN
jgi:hypothetical protein